MNENLHNIGSNQAKLQELGKPYESRRTFVHEFRQAEKKVRQSQELSRFAKLTNSFLGRVYKDSQNDSWLEHALHTYQELQHAQPADTDQGASPALVQSYQSIKNYLIDMYGYYFDQLDNYDFVASGKLNLEQGRFAEELQAKVQDQIITEVIHYLDARDGLPTAALPSGLALEHIIQGLSESSISFVDSQSFLAKHKGMNIQAVIRQLVANSIAEEAAYKVDQDVAVFSFREWVRESAKKYGKGTNIFETPFYKNLIQRCELLGDKENGIGGKIYYGPPGTGKTELALHVNRRQGFESRVISMHYWTDFASLLGEAPIPLGLDKATNYQQRVSKAIDRYTRMDDRSFVEAIKNMRFRQKGSVPQSDTVGAILPFVVGIDRNQFANRSLESLTPDETSSLKEGFLAYLDGQFMGASLGLDSGDNEENMWVNGEILIALDNRERVILDEIDKAGPNSLAGISRLLAARAGTEIQLKGKRVKLPSWFKIDATSNEVNLNPEKTYLYDRFNQIYVDYPPVIDELMMATVWLSDQEGNIMLTDSDQQQVITFFTEILPRLQDNYRKGVMTQPITLRGLKELCHVLVNPLTKERTPLSVRRAIEMVLLEQNAFTKNSGTGDMAVVTDMRMELSKMISEYAHLLPGGYTAVDLEQTELDSLDQVSATRLELYEGALKRITESPIALYVTNEGMKGQAGPEEIQTVSGELLAKSSLLTDVHLERSELSDEAYDRTQSYLAQGDEKSKAIHELNTDLPIDTDLDLEMKKKIVRNLYQVVISARAGSGSEQVLRRLSVPDEKGLYIADFTSDGEVIVMRKDDSDSHVVSVYKSTTEPKVKPEKPMFSRSFDSKADLKYVLAPNGRSLLMYSADNGRGKLVILDQSGSQQHRELTLPGNISANFQFSPDGRFLLVEDHSSESTLVYDISRLAVRQRGQEGELTADEPLRAFKAKGMKFVTSNLIASPGSKIAVSVVS